MCIRDRDGDGESRDLWDNAITHARERVPRLGWSNASQTFNGRLGVTYYVDLRAGQPAIRARVADYCRTKADEQCQPNWIGLGQGATGGLFVVVIERASHLSLADV